VSRRMVLRPPSPRLRFVLTVTIAVTMTHVSSLKSGDQELRAAQTELGELFKATSSTPVERGTIMQKMPRFCLRLQEFVKEKLGMAPLEYAPTDNELKGFLKAENCDVNKALLRLKEKAEWKSKLGNVNIRDVAPSLRSDGYSVCLEGLKSREGLPIIYSYGMPKGTADSIARQTAYLQERVMAASQDSRACREGYRSLVLINTTAPSFRFPDKAIRQGGVQVINKHYPWATTSTTVFIGVPKPVKMMFKMTKPIMGSMYDRFKFADTPEELFKYISPNNLPKEYGGTADWQLERYIKKRAANERVNLNILI